MLRKNTTNKVDVHDIKNISIYSNVNRSICKTVLFFILNDKHENCMKQRWKENILSTESFSKLLHLFFDPVTVISNEISHQLFCEIFSLRNLLC